MDFGETYAPVGRLTTFRHLTSLVRKQGWNMHHLDVVTAFLNAQDDDDDIYITLPEGWLESLNTSKIIVWLKKALYGHKQAPPLWHNDNITFLLSFMFKQSLADPNLYLRSDGILMLLYIDDIWMLYWEEPTKVAFEVKARLWEKYNLSNLSPARQILRIEIHREENGTGTSSAIPLGQKAFIATILKWFNLQNAQGESTPMDPNVKLDLTEDRGGKELQNIKGYQAVVISFDLRGTSNSAHYLICSRSTLPIQFPPFHQPSHLRQMSSPVSQIHCRLSTAF